MQSGPGAIFLLGQFMDELRSFASEEGASKSVRFIPYRTMHQAVLLRGTIVTRTYGKHKDLYI